MGLPRRLAGLTLIEVLVALALWAVMTAMMTQGMDLITRSQQQQVARSDAHARLQASLAQWQTDLDQLDDTSSLPQAMDWNGQVLRWVRHSPVPYRGHRSVVAWGLRGGQWVRWQSPPLANSSDLASAWEAALQALNTPPLGGEGGGGWVGAQNWQVVFFFDDSWSNALSSRGATNTSATTTAATTTSTTATTSITTGTNSTTTNKVNNPHRDNTLPDAIRLELNLTPGGGWQGPIQWVWVRPNWSVNRS